MTVLLGDDAADESCSGPPRKKYRLCLSSRVSQGRASHDNPDTVKSAMLNGYIHTDGHNKSSTDDSPVSDGTGCSPVATLCNLGNTCFLNSVIYTLRFAPAFLHNLHHLVDDLADASSKQQIKVKSSSLGRNIGSSTKSWSSKDLLSLGSSSNTNDMHGKSRIQVATERLHELYSALRISEIKENCDPFQPDVFLHALREVNPIFEGNQQHDAHELLVCLLDNIRETCRLLSNQLEARQAVDLLDNSDSLEMEPKMSGAATLPSSSKSWGVRKSWKKRKNVSSVTKNSSNGLSNGVVSSGRDVSQESTLSLVNGGAGSHQLSSGISEITQMSSSSVPSDSMKTDSSSTPELDKDSKKQSAGYNFVADDFEGVAVLRTTCLECEHVTERKETFCDICVPIVRDQETDKGEIPQCVSEVYQAAIVTSENLRELNKYWCEQCLRYNEACRSVRYETLPRLLVLQLKRFSSFSSTFGSVVCMSKVNDYMPTPLKLACFCEQCCSLPEEKRPHQYQLYGVIMHLGATIASGHYVAYVKASENNYDYLHCCRDKRKAANLSSGSGKSSGSSGEKMGGILKFFRPKSSSSGIDISSKSTGSATGSNLINRNMCHSMDCCGVKLNNSLMGMHTINGVGDLMSLGYPNKERDNLNPLKSINNLPVDGIATSVTDASVPEPVWLECDDDTVRLLTRKEFEDVLAPKPSKTSALTPYLLFYSKM